MRRPAFLVWLPLSLALAAGCSRAPAPPAAPADPPAQAGLPPALGGDRVVRDDGARPEAGAIVPAVAAAEASAQEKYDAALLDALNLLAERKHAEALAALEAARAAQDTDLVRREIEKLKATLAQQSAAERTQQDIQAVLNDGKADEAARLAAAALQQYGGTDSAEHLARLKRQADALAAAQLTDAAARRDRFRQEGEAALREKNLRAAAIAFEQALQHGDDAALRKQLDEARAALARYDAGRQKAAELRRDAARLEEAIAALQDAAGAWDTLQVRPEIDECTLALQKRRDRVGVADFEVRGDVGIPAAGRTVAEELLPGFKARFDLVERTQINKVLDELKLEATDLAANDEGRREAGRLAKLRYLVVGSVSRTGGITVSARLVDVSTGLVVQTGRVAVAAPEDVVPALPQLAGILMMTDEQKIAFEQQLARQAEVRPAQAAAPLPEAPEPVQVEQPPPPVVIQNAPPPDFGGLRPEEFDRLPQPPPQGQGFAPPVIVVERENPIKQRLLHVCVELGDNLFRRGCYREAYSHFEMAFNLYPDRHDLRLRLDRCRPHLPPPVVIVRPVPVRQRLAVLNFVEAADPRVVRPGSGAWVAGQIAPYYCPPYDVVDRGELFWYMARLGLSVRDVLHEPAARRWLGRALGVRYFVFGSLRQSGDGADATAHLVDAEYGFEYGAGRIHVHDPIELKLRLGELARLTLLPHQQRVIVLQQAEQSQELVIEARQRFKKGEFAIALQFSEKALKLRPDNVELRVLFQSSRERARQAELEEARRREFERQQVIAAELQRRQFELARQAEEARLLAEREAAVLAAAGRARQEQQRDLAYNQLIVQGQAAFQANNFQVSIQIFQSAVALKRTDEGFRALALARARAEEAARARAAEEALAREAALRQQRDQEIQQIRAQVIEERQQIAAREKALLEAQATRDQATYARLLDDAQRQMAKGEFDPAISALQTARQLRKTDEVERLLNQALVAQAQATAQKQDAPARADLERRLAEEKVRREKAELEAKKNRELYVLALKLAKQAMAEKRYDVATVQFQEARKVFQTDEVLTGLREAQEAQKQDKARADAEAREQAEERTRAAELDSLMTQGRLALETKQFDRAVKAFRDASKKAPGNVDVLAALSKAEQARDDATAVSKRQKEDQERQAAFQKLLDSGKASVAAKQYDAAAVALNEALKLKPNDPAAKAALQEAEKGKTVAVVDAARAAENKKKLEEYQKALADGRLALSTKQYDAAIKAFREAQKLLPGDQASANCLADAEKAKKDAADVLAAEAKKREEERKRAADLQRLLTQGRAALAAKDLASAEKALAAAAQLAPADAAVKQAQQDLQKARDAAKAVADAEAKKQQEAAKLAEQVKQLLTAGRAALNAKQWDNAAKAFADAGKLAPQDAGVRQALRDLESARKAEADAKVAADADARKKEEEKRRAEFTRLITQGQAARTAKKYDDAVKAFADAAKLMPGETTAQTLLQQATKARDDAKTAADAAAKQKLEDETRRDQVKQLLAAGNAALTAKKIDDAAKAFADANKLAPQDPAVQQALRDLDRAKAAAAQDAEKQKQQAAYQAAMKTGNAALTAKRYDEAVKAFTEARRLMPGDQAALTQLKAAEKARDDVKAAADAAAKQKQEEEKRKADFTRLMTQGQTAMSAKKYAEAVTAFTAATKLQPGDKDAAKALADATKALEASKAPPPNKPEQPKAPPAEYTKQMQAGAAAEQKQKYADAVKAYGEALRLVPKDPKATAALQFAGPMAEGQKAMAAKKFKDAVKEFEAALKASPKNPDAEALLKKAKEGR